MVATTRRPRTRNQQVQAPDPCAAFFQCPSCAHPLSSRRQDRLICSKCEYEVADNDGIIDFVAGAASTQLDDIDYDAFYGISAEHSQALFALLRRTAGQLWPAEFGHALEIGCGTGGLSLALFSQVKAADAVLTDISPKMLRLCRARLRQAIPDRVQAFSFATYSGTEQCFRPATFDSCFGTAVVHHIVDVPRFLRQVSALLKPDGFAFFMEPNLPFHRALSATLAEIIGDLLQSGEVQDRDLDLTLNWMAEVHCNAVNTGDVEVLAEREDKHQFEAATFLDWARAQGFGDVVALPCDPDPTGWGTLANYLKQAGVSEAGLAALSAAWPQRCERHFGGLDPRDQSPSYLFWLRKTVRRRTVRPREAPPAAVQTQPQAPVQTWLEFRVNRSADGARVHVNGWCLADIPVASLQISIGDKRRRLPIWRPRPDIHALLNRDGRYPPLHALCCGIDGIIDLGPSDTAAPAVEMSLQIVTVAGPMLDLGPMTVETGRDDSQTLHREIAPLPPA